VIFALGTGIKLVGAELDTFIDGKVVPVVRVAAVIPVTPDIVKF
jgi:hypothetical protein